MNDPLGIGGSSGHSAARAAAQLLMAQLNANRTTAPQTSARTAETVNNPPASRTGDPARQGLNPFVARAQAPQPQKINIPAQAPDPQRNPPPPGSYIDVRI